MLLGQVSWNQNQKEDSLSYFLKAAKVRDSSALGTSFMGPVFRIRIHWIHMFLGHKDPDPLVRGMDPDPDPSIMKQK